jgi:hypothetical protein
MSGETLTCRRLDPAAGAVVHLALGLLSATRRVDALVAQYARPLPRTAEHPAPAKEDALHLVLGLIAFRKKLHTTLEAAAPPPPPIAPATEDRVEVVPCR